jgi:hypothetical protein
MIVAGFVYLFFMPVRLFYHADNNSMKEYAINIILVYWKELVQTGGALMLIING